MAVTDTNQNMPVVGDPKNFDMASGGRLERLVFGNRVKILIFWGLATLFLAYHASLLHVTANYNRMIPQKNQYIKNYFANLASLKPLSNSLHIAIENTKGDIFDPKFLEIVKQVNDRMYLTPGVRRAFVNSIWSPLASWIESTPQGYKSGRIITDSYTGSKQDMAEIRQHILKAGMVGTLVANDMKSAMVIVPLLDKYPSSGKPINYSSLLHHIQKDILPLETENIKIHITGFGYLMGILISATSKVLLFFVFSVFLIGALIFFYTRCLRSTILLLALSAIGVIWLLGLFELFGYELTPYSILVPFLIFSISCSHGCQKLNCVMLDMARGCHKYVAGRYTFRRLFVPGLTALLANMVGFAVLMLIDIPAIKALALATSMGVTVLIFTTLVLVPVSLSYLGVSKLAARRRNEIEHHTHADHHRGWIGLLVALTQRRYALCVLGATAILWAGAYYVSLNLQVGDLGPGAPELYASSQYNQNVDFINDHFGLSSDRFAAIVKAKDGANLSSYNAVVEIARLEQKLKQLHGVNSAISVADYVRQTTMRNFQGQPRWYSIPRNQFTLTRGVRWASNYHPAVINRQYTLGTVIAYLKDHKAVTLRNVLDSIVAFGKKHNNDKIEFVPAAGPAGIAAITNIVVAEANRNMLIYLYLAVTLLCFLNFRNWRAVIVALVPLLLTSTLCEALMVLLGIGVKVATLPAIALGIGVGIDYAIYILHVQLKAQRRGVPVDKAYAQALGFTGRIVALIGVTMAVGVVTWIASPIKFQGEMGLLLAFMFLWNMVGALVLIPALSTFLLPTNKVMPKKAQAG